MQGIGRQKWLLYGWLATAPLGYLAVMLLYNGYQYLVFRGKAGGGYGD